MQKPDIARAFSRPDYPPAHDAVHADADALLALGPSEQQPLVLGRRSAAAMLADILVASEDMSS